MPLSNLRQADVPEGMRTITPVRGTAPGLVAELPGGERIYAVPGVPVEMEEMMEGTILAELAALAGPATIVSRTLRSASLGESRVAEMLRDLFEASSNPSVAYLASSSEVKVRLTAKAATREEAESMLAPLVAEVRARLGDALFTVDDEELEEAVGRLLRAAGKTLACAESLTGGGVGARLTSVAGASDYFVGSAVVYTAEAKRSVLGVSQETIDGPGVVSERVRPRDGRGGSARVRRRRRSGVDGSRRTRAARRRRSGHGVDGARRRRCAARASGSACRANGSASVAGRSRRASTWSGGTSRACRCPVSDDLRAFDGGGRGRVGRGPDATAVPRRRGAARGRSTSSTAAIRPWRDVVPERTLGAAGELARDAEVPRLDGRRADAVGRRDRGTVAGAHPPVTLRVRGLGAFPSTRRARVLWAGIDDPADVLAALVADLEAGLAEEFRAEVRRFHPHLTVARSEPPLRLAGALRGHAARLGAVRRRPGRPLPESSPGRSSPKYEPLRDVRARRMARVLVFEHLFE